MRLSRVLGSVLGPVAIAAGLVAAPAVAHADQPVINWGPCPEGVTEERAECGHVTVPTYHNAPEKGTIDVGLIRLKATGERQGTLFTNPGGPGGDAYSWVNFAAWPEEVKQGYDIIGVQPRGLRESAQVNCSSTEAGGNPLEQLTKIGSITRDDCEKNTPGYTDSLTTENTAKDWDVVRQALGEEKINIFGLSYGTFLGSTYSTLYPEHTDKVVLDSGMNPNMAWNQIFASQQAGYENALHDFFNYVAKNDATYHAGTTPLKAYERWSQIVAAEAGVRPTVLPPNAQIGDLPPGLEFAGQPGANVMTATGELRVQAEHLAGKVQNPQAVQATSPTLTATRDLLPRPESWDSLAKHIGGVEAINFEEQAAQQGEQDPQKVQQEILNSMSMQNIIMCNENTAPTDPAFIPAFLWSNYVTVDPFSLFNAMYASGAGCSGRAPITTPIAVSGDKLQTKPLQLQATGDPQTPYAFYRGLSDPMQSRVVTVHGPGHGHFAVGNKAVDQIVVDYLRTGDVRTADAPGFFDQPQAQVQPAQ